MKNAMDKTSKANQNVDVWLRQAVAEYLKRSHPRVVLQSSFGYLLAARGCYTHSKASK